MTQPAPHSAGPVHNAPAHPPQRSARRRALPALVALTALALATGAGLMWWQRLHARVDSSTLEPVAATTSILVPAEHEAAAAPPAASAVAAAASVPSAVEATEDRVASLRGTVDQLTARVAALEETDRTRGEEISAFRTDLERMTAERRADREKAAERTKQDMHAGAAPGARAIRTAGGRRAMPSSQPAVASILAVDLWGGQPSVVVGKEGADGTELRFINQGETQGRVTLKRADVGSQRATFTTPAGELTMSAGER